MDFSELPFRWDMDLSVPLEGHVSRCWFKIYVSFWSGKLGATMSGGRSGQTTWRQGPHHCASTHTAKGFSVPYHTTKSSCMCRNSINTETGQTGLLQSRWMTTEDGDGIAEWAGCGGHSMTWTSPIPTRQSALGVTAAGEWLRNLLRRTETVGDIRLATHSCKATLLSWCSKAHWAHDDRRLLGYHTSSADSSMLVYSRDAMAGPLRALWGVISKVVSGEFNTRSFYYPSDEEIWSWMENGWNGFTMRHGIVNLWVKLAERHCT